MICAQHVLSLSSPWAGGESWGHCTNLPGPILYCTACDLPIAVLRVCSRDFTAQQGREHQASAAAEGTQHWGKAAREKATVSNISQNSLFSSVEIRKRERWQGQQGQASSCSFKALTDESSNSTTLK